MEDFIITKREILFSTIIICVMIGLGVWVSNPILQKTTEKSLKIVSSVTVSDLERFDYIRRTNAGDFLAEGSLVAINPVTLPEIDGEYLKVVKVKEKYTMHTQTYTTSDGKGHTQTHTRTYWSWDVVSREAFCVDSVLFLGQRFKLEDINYSAGTDYKETQSGGHHIRYKYYTHPSLINGVMIGNCDNKKYEELKFMDGSTIEKMIETAEKSINNSPIIFWCFWSFLTIILVLLFFKFENNWLEENKHIK